MPGELAEWLRQFETQLQKNVRNARKALRMPQKEFAERCGVKPCHASSWETGRIRISVARLAIIADALGVPPLSLWPQYDFETSTEETGIDPALHDPTP
jgi:transcriptional regulator with XRE-family HTH domain